MNKLKGIVHDFIHVFCISCFCFSYLCLRAPTPIKAEESNSLPFYMQDFILNQNRLYRGDYNKYDFNVKSSDVAFGIKAIFEKYPDIVKKSSYLLRVWNNSYSSEPYIIVSLHIPQNEDTLTLVEVTGDVKFKETFDNYTAIFSDGTYQVKKNTNSPTKAIYINNLQDTVNFTTQFPIAGYFDFNNVSGVHNSPSNSSYGSFNFSSDTVNNNISMSQLYDWAMNGTIPDLTPSTGYCTFTWFKDYETVDELLQAIAINPGQQSLNPYVMVSSSKSASSCEEKGTKNLYNTGSFRIVNGIPEFMYTMPPCKDEQIPTADNVFYYGTEVPETGQQQYHAVCTYDGKTVYEYKEGSTGGGLVPDEPDYGIFQPLVDLLNSIFAPITSLLNMFFGNFSTSLETLFKNLFVPSETYFNDKWNGFYSKFNQKFPFISDIKPLADSFIAMATNSNTSRPDFTVTLPEFAGGQTVQIVDLTWFDEYRSMIHAGILFFIYTTFILRLPRKTASAIGGTTS